jgi:hypothetical protein
MVNYNISIEKDKGGQVAVHYYLSVPVGGTELIATFQVWVDGEGVVKERASGNTRFFGTVYTKLVDETKDVPVSFDLTSNQGFEATDSDTLRGDKPYDESEFSN